MSVPGSAPRAYVDRPVGDVAAAVDAARAAADEWGLDEPRLLRRGMNVIFEAGDVVLRVSTPSVPATASIELTEFLKASADVAVPTAARTSVVVHGDYQVTCWDRIEPDDRSIDWAAVGAMVARVHRLDPDQLPRTVPLPAPTVFGWWDFDELLRRTTAVLDAPARRGIEAVLERHRGWRELEECVVCHGDVHPGNVMMTAGGPVLIDWDLLCWAPRGWDHAPLMTWAERWGGRPGEYEAFAAGYGMSLHDDPVAVAFAELRLVAATLMRLVAAMTDPAAMPEAQQRLRYWRGDHDAPAWTAQ